MDIFNVLNLIGGLCLFLFGMNLMGQALERRAGGKLRSLLGKMTGRKLAGFATGLGITAVIQSSSATTVMVVGFCQFRAADAAAGDQRHHGRQRRHDGHSMAAQPRRNPERRRVGAAAEAVVVHASAGLIGIVLYMFCKSGKKKDTGMILLGFATLMFGMETMTGAVAGLKNVPQFTQLFLAFTNPSSACWPARS